MAIFNFAGAWLIPFAAGNIEAGIEAGSSFLHAVKRLPVRLDGGLLTRLVGLQDFVVACRSTHRRKAAKRRAAR
jgi:hypothetical protein